QQVADPGGVVGARAPLGHEGVQGGQLAVVRQAGTALVVVGCAADQDAVRAGGEEYVGPTPADQQVASQAADQHVLAGAPHQTVLGAAAAGRGEVVAGPAVQQGRHRNQVPVASDKARLQQERIVTCLAVNDDVSGRPVVAQGGAGECDIDVP